MNKLFTVCALWAYSITAMAASDLFSKATEKTDAIGEVLPVRSIAIAITILVVTIVGFALMFNKLQLCSNYKNRVTRRES